MYEYEAQVLRIIDGDTLRLKVDVGFFMTTAQNFRIAGINTPEIHGRESVLGRACRNYVAKLVPPGAHVRIRTYKTGKYGRWMCDVIADLPDGSGSFDLAKRLLREGWAKEYDGKGPMPRFDPIGDHPALKTQ